MAGLSRRDIKSSCHSIQRESKRVIQKGKENIQAGNETAWGQRTCFIADPEGNIIEIGSWNKPYEEKDK